VPIVSGMGISLLVHGMKAAVRPVVNASTAGVGAPVASTVEDIFSVFMSFFAILFPVLIVVFLIVLIWGFVALRRRRRRRREEKLARKQAERLAREGAQDGRTLDLWRGQ
jgi:flagellar biosynthesis/type III secretory pathway M-ring protein FliF/YscJ